MRRFVINLKRRPERLEQFFKRCPYPKESIEVIEAFDGKFPEKESKPERKMVQKFRKHIQMGARGCAITHFRIWKKMINENIPIAMIFEDDAQFSEFFYEFMETLTIPENINILYFGGRFHPDFIIPDTHLIKVNDKIYKHNHENQWNMMIHERTTHGYIITSRLARFLIHLFEINETNNEEIDHHMIHTFRGLNLPYYSTYPLVCWSPMISDSDIR